MTMTQYDRFLSPKARASATATRARKRARVAARTVRGVIIPTSAAQAVGRFRPEGPLGYRAARVPDAPLRDNRDEAETDWLHHHHHPAAPDDLVASTTGPGTPQ